MRRMLRRAMVLALGWSLSGCTDNHDERIAELDEHAPKDCGLVDNYSCSPPAHVDEVVACLRDSLAADAGARAVFILGLDPVAFVYALDGVYVSIEGYCIGGDHDDCEFTEYRCRAIEVVPHGMCSTARPTECTAIRDWH